MSDDVALAVHDLDVGYEGGAFALHVEHLALQRGRVLALLGKNGAGKSTLLRAMAGLLPPRSGRVELRPGAGVGLVFQRPVLMRGSVAYNVGLPLWAQAVPRAERARRVAAALERFGIGSLAERDAATLSGGEARRAALARALVGDPEIVLLDEPFDDLDVEGRETLSLDLARAIAEAGIAAAIVTHELRQALLLADDVAVLRAGRLEQHGPRDHVLRRPASPAVAALVGMANRLTATVIERDAAGLAVLEFAPGARLRASCDAAPGTRVWVGIRPEHVKLDADRNDPNPVGTANVQQLVSDGVLVTAWIDWGGLSLRAHLLAGRGLGHTLKRSDGVWLAIRPEDVHVLPL